MRINTTTIETKNPNSFDFDMAAIQYRVVANECEKRRRSHQSPIALEFSLLVPDFCPFLQVWPNTDLAPHSWENADSGRKSSER
jgi:hypothetical protein